MLLFGRIQCDVAHVFGSKLCLPHPGLFVCPACNEPKRLGSFCKLDNALKHLGCCRHGARAKIFLRREFELRFHGEIRTALPAGLEPPGVEERKIFHFTPNKLADGTELDWDLFLLHRLISSGKLRREHLLLQMIGAFVTPFFGLGTSHNFPWHRYQTLWMFAETAQSMSNRFFELMSQNGQVGAHSHIPDDANSSSGDNGGAENDDSNERNDGRADADSDGRANSGSDGRANADSDGRVNAGSDGANAGSDGCANSGSDGRANADSDGRANAGSDGANAGSDGHPNSGSDGRANADSDGRVNSGSDGHANADSDGGANAGSDDRANAEPEGGANAASDGRANAGSDGHANSGSDGHANADSDGRVNSGSDGRANADSDGGANAGSDGRANADPDGRANAGSDGRANAGSDGRANAGSDGRANAGPDGRAGGRVDSHGDACVAAGRARRRPQYYLDPHDVNLIMPDGRTLECWRFPIEPEQGPPPKQLPPLLRLLLHLHKEDPSRGIMIERDGGVYLSPAILKFDGTTVAGGLSQIGTGDLAQLIGSTERITLATVHQWMRRDLGGYDDEEDESGEPHEPGDSDSVDTELDVARVEEHAKRLAPKLVRGVDAYLLQSLIVPVHIFFGNYYHILASAVRAVTVGQQVEARYCDSFHYHPGTVIAVDDTGAATIRYDKHDQQDQARVPRAHIRLPAEQAYLQIAEQVCTMISASQCCLGCAEAGCTTDECVVWCGVCCAESNTGGKICAECQQLGYAEAKGHAKHENCKCKRCQQLKIDCVRLRACMVESDKEAKNKRGLHELLHNALFKRRLCGRLFVVHGPKHAAKGARGLLVNWQADIDGMIVGVVDFLALYTQPYEPLRAILRKEVGRS